jgi:MinD-like ATPase involved in chromosome partitioning or flagellar assembly
MKRVVSIYGADSKVGVTMLAQCLSKSLADTYKDKKILLLHCDGHPGMNYFFTSNAIRFGIDNLKAKLISDLLTLQELLDCCVSSGNLYILPGVYNFGDRKYYQPENVEALIKIALTHFDLVLIDAGSNLDLGLTVGALLYADVKILVTTQKNSAKVNYQAMNNQILSKININKFDCLLVNEFIKSGGLLSEKQIKLEYGIEDVYLIPWSDFGWQADNEETILTELDEVFRNKLTGIQNFIVGRIGFEPLKKDVKGGMVFQIKRLIGDVKNE